MKYEIKKSRKNRTLFDETHEGGETILTLSINARWMCGAIKLKHCTNVMGRVGWTVNVEGLM